MSNKVTIVYQDTKGRCRVLVNPANLEKYLNKDNVAVNPDIAGLLERGATPDRWYIEEGEIKVKSTKEKNEISKLDIYDLFLDVEDKKDEISKWFQQKESDYSKLSNNIFDVNSRLDRLDRYVSKVERKWFFLSKAAIAFYILISCAVAIYLKAL